MAKIYFSPKFILFSSVWSFHMSQQFKILHYFDFTTILFISCFHRNKQLCKMFKLLNLFWQCNLVGYFQRDFDHRCILFAHVVWKNTAIWPWMENSCDFVLYVTLGVTFFYALSMAIFTLLAVLPRSNPRYDTFRWVFSLFS